MCPKFKIIQLELKDIPQIIPICNEELGKGFITEKSAIYYINNPFCQSLAAVNPLNNEIIGTSICLFFSQKEFKAFLHPSQYIHLPNSFTQCEKIGVLKLIAIQKEFQKKGLGSEFINASFKFFQENNIQTICAFAWESKTGINMKTIFDRNHLSTMNRIDNFWTKDSLEKQYDCPECGSPPCKCTAVIFIKH